ncbi:MAG TPA: CoA pyrophosphatase [Candidatus Dormibacteraeota bacterium]|nr:CoA pyrophosphatase [Candidatus Dormibacteraeota bacterium]
MNVDEIAARLVAVRPAPPVRGRRAAVIALLVPGPAGELVVPFTRRSYHLRLHPGEIGLPGGSWEPGDGEDLARTALRELQEELGVDPAAVRILGRLPDVSTVVSDFAVAPYVGYLPERRPWVCGDGEVDEIFELPLAEIIRPGAVRYAAIVMRGRERNVIALDYGPHHIWGATGRILRELVNALGEAAYRVPESAAK